MSPVVAVNGRFLTAPITGVQRYARALLGALPDHVDGAIQVIVPPRRILDARDPSIVASVELDPRWQGPRGHAWEQVALPALVRRLGPNVPLLSPANWGPAALRAQVPIFHDIAPQTYPEQFRRSYRVMADRLTPLLTRRSARVGVTCQTVGEDLVHHFGLSRDRLDVIPVGVWPPFDRWPVEDLARRPSRYCVFVGAHDRRKNLSWLLEWWPRAAVELDLDLVVTTRDSATTRFMEELDAVRRTPRVSVRMNPDDQELAGLLAGAMCLVWPSLYEGYGLPLVEAMAVGTPFLSTDTGAAAELALEPDWILPLEPSHWIDRLAAWRSADLQDLRARCVAVARARSWGAAGEAAAQALERARTVHGR